MAKLIELTEAAEMLGISPEELTDMRSRNEIFGYRDGSTWKFKLQEIERVMADKGLGAAGGVGDTLVPDDAASSDDDADVIELSDGDDSDSILVSEEELGQSDENTASTIIGEADDLIPGDSGIGGGSDALAGGSDVELSLEASDAMAASDVLGDLGDDVPTASDTANLNVVGESSGSLQLEDSGPLQDSGSLDLDLGEVVDGGSRIEVSDDSQASSSGFGSAIDLGLDDDELVLGSGAGSDVTLGAGDSGISLSNPADSGLSLEEPLDLASGSGVESLELGEDEELIELDETLIPDDGPSENDFLLEPMGEGLDEESDSGSQVIALDSDEVGPDALMDDAGAAVLDDEDPIVVEDTTGPGAPIERPATSALPTEEEADFSVLNVLSLFGVIFVLGLTGIFMLDIVSNIWTWDQPFSFSSTLMDAILGMMPG